MTSNQPYSEQYRLAAKDWVDKEAAAQMLEETKSAVLSQWKNESTEKTDAAKERAVKGSEEWANYISKMVDARKAANLAKVRLKYMEMRYFENQGAEASKRAEMRMG